MQSFRSQIEQLIAQEPRVSGLVEALENTMPSVSVRVNTAKSKIMPNEIAGEAVGGRVPWCETGLYLDRRPQFIFDPAMHQGVYYVQDASSMFINYVIKALAAKLGDEPLVYLDACAAPGGKTTAAMEALPEGSMVVANEWDYRRAEILRENVMKWGYPGVVISRGDTAKYRKLKNMFDIIAADVPCSGEGMMRKDAEAVEQWSPALVEQCAERQREIVDNLWVALKPGGYLIYSTCTFNRAENEEMVDYLVSEVGAEPVTIEAGSFEGILPGIATSYPCCRFMPHRVRGEGLFMAVVRKPGERVATSPVKLSRDKNKKRRDFKVEDWFPTDCEYMTVNDTIYGILPQYKQLVDRISAVTDVIMPGTEIATIKGRDLVPSQGIAMSRLLRLDAVNSCEVDKPTALAYLRRDAIMLPADAPRGHVLLTYGGVPLGWVKNLGNRANNLYPANWRILRQL